MAALAEAQFRILRELAGGEPDPVQRGRTHRGAHGGGRAHPPAASPPPRSAPSSRNGPAPSALGAASSSTAPGPSPCPPQAASPLRQGGARPPRRPHPPTGGAGSTTWGPAGPDADSCGDAPSRPGPRRLRPDPRVHAPLRTGHDQRAPQTRPISPAARRPRHRHPPAGSAPPNTSTHTRRPTCASPGTHH